MCAIVAWTLLPVFFTCTILQCFTAPVVSFLSLVFGLLCILLLSIAHVDNEWMGI